MLNDIVADAAKKGADHALELKFRAQQSALNKTEDSMKKFDWDNEFYYQKVFGILIDIAELAKKRASDDRATICCAFDEVACPEDFDWQMRSSLEYLMRDVVGAVIKGREAVAQLDWQRVLVYPRFD
ncbi:hypothetical protein HY489_01000 [Candidatus Woesearchaeota archaeon]|nr:hypothetical protein [Candidatus Woesearchaeota archaeon]